jgi:hypothetical protein
MNSLSKNMLFFFQSQNFAFSLWNLLNAEHGHICEVCVPILLHCITLPCGLDVFWNVIQKSFHQADWKQRFTAGKNMHADFKDPGIFSKNVLFQKI